VSNRNSYAIGATILVVAALLPLLLSDYLVHIGVLVLMYAYLATAWNILGGYAGQHSLGHALFLGIGAYTSTYLFTRFGVTPWISMWLGMALAGIAGWAVGDICFRFGLKGSYFALVTIALAEAAVYLVTSSDALGGNEGLAVTWVGNRPDLMQFTDKRAYYYLILVMTAGIIALSGWIAQRRFGYQLVAVRENEDAAEALGIDTLGIKVRASIISAVLTALGGVFFAQYFTYVNPRAVFGEGPSVQILLFAIIGGLGTVWGPALGALVLAPIAEFSRAAFSDIFSGANLLIYGIVLVVVMLFFPKGLMGLLENVRRK
jgi:branched-chain amino acid transport system permease protein